jgi:hypothetical protein
MDVGSGLWAFVELPDGTLLPGIARDSSSLGVGIDGPTTSLAVGSEVTVWLSFEDLKRLVGAGYSCEVKHLHDGEEFFGVELKSRPWIVAQSRGRSV